MERLIVFDSIFGNTEKIARRIGKALGSRASTATLHVREVRAEHLEGLKLLLVGSPARAFRATGAIVGFVGSFAPGALDGVGVAAFDTRISTTDTNSRFLSFMVRLFGYAAESIARKLQKKGGRLAALPEGMVPGHQFSLPWAM